MNQIETQVKALVAFEDKMVPGAVKTAMKDSGAKSSDLWRVPYAQIKVRPDYNPRIDTPAALDRLNELAASMVQNGYFDDKPIGVSVAVEDGKQVLYIEDGHRRHRAAGIAIANGAPIETLPVVVLPRSMNEIDRLVHMVHSNNDGEPFKPLELGIIVQRMQKFGLDEAAIATRLTVTTTYVRQLTTLMSAPASIRDMVKSGEISATLAIETVQQHKDEAAEVMAEAKEAVKATPGKRVTGKTVKVAAEVVKKKKGGKLTKAEAEAKSQRLQKKHATEAFALLQAVFDKHGKVIDNKYHVEVDGLFVKCGVI